MTDYPHVTVATVVEKDGLFLMVREGAADNLVYNQPAGHLELGESLTQAALRETLEETSWKVELTGLLGIYHFTSAANGITYVRHCFIANPVEKLANFDLDPDIHEALWMSLEDIKRNKNCLRSPLVLGAVEDYLTKPHYPLSVINTRQP